MTISNTCPKCGEEFDDPRNFVSHIQTCDQKTKKSKYRNTPTKYKGIRYDSKLEAQYAEYLDIKKSAGLISYWLRQVPFSLPGNVKYRVDFMVVDEAPEATIIEYIDVKGTETNMFKLKKKQVEDLYPITIEIVKKGEFKIYGLR